MSSFYEQEIETILSKLYVSSCSCMYRYYNLHDVSLFFRLLRQHGHCISADVFNNFKGKDGRFRRNLRQDIRGLVELYEAGQLSVEGEHILDEAASFSSHLLRECLPEMDNNLSRMITGKLRHPYHKTVARLTRKDFLQDFEGINGWGKTLRELAVMDLRKGQSVFQGELVQVSNLSLQRVELTKSIAFVYLIDDIFDVVGTLDELTIFTEAEQALLDTTNAIGLEIYKMHGHYPIDSLKTSWASLCNAFPSGSKMVSLWGFANSRQVFGERKAASFKRAALNGARMVPLMYGYDDNQRLPVLEEYVKFFLFNRSTQDHHHIKEE
ncbi:UNVERIFIED_CONTAM: Tricyclene synthase 0e23, chloroplastic [Sesamum latifolium]|uniref:Tricyclene synthase 0e23, chloroplastic n=1 Tax=Sesamum latifolium TaxID=2727402 RepID=A0AAW2WM68_9LAMI